MHEIQAMINMGGKSHKYITLRIVIIAGLPLEAICSLVKVGSSAQNVTGNPSWEPAVPIDSLLIPFNEPQTCTCKEWSGTGAINWSSLSTSEANFPGIKNRSPMCLIASAMWGNGKNEPEFSHYIERDSNTTHARGNKRYSFEIRPSVLFGCMFKVQCFKRQPQYKLIKMMMCSWKPSRIRSLREYRYESCGLRNRYSVRDKILDLMHMHTKTDFALLIGIYLPPSAMMYGWPTFLNDVKAPSSSAIRNASKLSSPRSMSVGCISWMTTSVYIRE